MVNNPFCILDGAGNSDSERSVFLFFSSAQKWTNNSHFLRSMASFLSQERSIQSVLISPLKSHEDAESPALSVLEELPNVRRFSSLSYRAHSALLKKCTAVMDWSSMNIEREYSTSTRLIHGVASGAAIFGNGNTGLDRFWNSYPGMAPTDAPDEAVIGSFLGDVNGGIFRDSISNARRWNDLVLNNQCVFGGIG